MPFDGWSWISYLAGIATIAVPSLCYFLVLCFRAPVMDNQGRVEGEQTAGQKPAPMVGGGSSTKMVLMK